MASGGDCIIRSPDGSEFKVVKAILSLGSTIFRDMFDMPQAGRRSEDEANIPVIPVEEDPETMQALLRLLYPIEPPPIESFFLARKLVTACDKYFVNTAKVQLHLKGILNNRQSMEEHPLECYTLSWELGMKEEAIAASRYTHSVDLSDNGVAKEIFSQSGNLEALTKLWDLRFRREKALDDILALAQDNRNMACHKHPRATGSVKNYSVRKEALRVALIVPNPSVSNVETFLGYQAGRGDPSCPACDDRRVVRLAENQKRVTEALCSYPQAIKG
ncbi:hypothetical protein FRC05_007246 [Tulasnella sp. 425]|nr:hypothetical protein FRC05_007246 [Tulasnella sp. 425]